MGSPDEAMNPDRSADLACFNKCCILPAHIYPFDDGLDVSRDLCHDRTMRLLHDDQPVPLCCDEHEPPCLTGSAAIGWQGHVVACWLWHSGYASLREVPLEEMPILPDAHGAADAELRTCKLESIGGRPYLIVTGTHTLRAYLSDQLAIAESRRGRAESRPMSLSPSPEASPAQGAGAEVDLTEMAAMFANLKETAADPQILRPGDVGELIALSPRVNYPVQPHLSGDAGKDLRELELKLYKEWLASDHARDACRFMNAEGANNGGAICMLCISEVYRCLNGAHRWPRWPRHCRSKDMAKKYQKGNVPKTIIDHVVSHHHSDTIKALCLSAMLDGVK